MFGFRVKWFWGIGIKIYLYLFDNKYKNEYLIKKYIYYNR